MDFDVRRIAKLAMLKFSEEETEKFEKEFSRMISMVENLPEISGMDTLLDQDNLMDLREDTVVPSTPRIEILSNVPHQVAGCIVVPKTVE